MLFKNTCRTYGRIGRSFAAISLTFLVGYLTSACNFQEVKNAPPTGSQDQSRVADPTDWQLCNDGIFKPLCVSCHSAASAKGGVILDSSAAIRDGHGKSGEPLVVKGNGKESLLFKVIDDGRMPPGGKASVDPSLLLLLEKWLAAGAPGDSHSGDGTGLKPTPTPTSTPTLRPTPAVTPTLAPTQEPGTTMKYQDLMDKVITANCMGGCHDAGNSAGGINLSSYTAMMASHPSTGAMVDAGNPSGSMLFTVVASDDMPYGGPALPAEQKNLIKLWIEQGAHP